MSKVGVGGQWASQVRTQVIRTVYYTFCIQPIYSVLYNHNLDGTQRRQQMSIMVWMSAKSAYGMTVSEEVDARRKRTHLPLHPSNSKRTQSSLLCPEHPSDPLHIAQ